MSKLKMIDEGLEISKDNLSKLFYNRISIMLKIDYNVKDLKTDLDIMSELMHTNDRVIFNELKTKLINLLLNVRDFDNADNSTLINHLTLIKNILITSILFSNKHGFELSNSVLTFVLELYLILRKEELNEIDVTKESIVNMKRNTLIDLKEAGVILWIDALIGLKDKLSLCSIINLQVLNESINYTPLVTSVNNYLRSNRDGLTILEDSDYFISTIKGVTELMLTGLLLKYNVRISKAKLYDNLKEVKEFKITESNDVESFMEIIKVVLDSSEDTMTNDCKLLFMNDLRRLHN